MTFVYLSLPVALAYMLIYDQEAIYMFKHNIYNNQEELGYQ